jgi:hypothetical protein
MLPVVSLTDRQRDYDVLHGSGRARVFVGRVRSVEVLFELTDVRLRSGMCEHGSRKKENYERDNGGFIHKASSGNAAVLPKAAKLRENDHTAKVNEF